MESKKIAPMALFLLYFFSPLLITFGLSMGCGRDMAMCFFKSSTITMMLVGVPAGLTGGIAVVTKKYVTHTELWVLVMAGSGYLTCSLLLGAFFGVGQADLGLNVFSGIGAVMALLVSFFVVALERYMNRWRPENRQKR